MCCLDPNRRAPEGFRASDGPIGAVFLVKKFTNFLARAAGAAGKAAANPLRGSTGEGPDAVPG
jgi:hypothetical protein